MGSSFLISLFVILLALAIGIRWFLERREVARVQAGAPRHGRIRLILATLGILTVLFSGGCGAIFLGDVLSRASSGSADDFLGWEIVAVFTIPPLLLGALVWWLSMRRGSG